MIVFSSICVAIVLIVAASGLYAWAWDNGHIHRGPGFE